MTKIGLLIAGKLRFKNKRKFTLFLNSIEGYDIFISTYTIYEKLAKKITNNVIFLDKHPDYKTTYQSNMYQWFHLQNLIREYKTTLVDYVILYRLRTDIKFHMKLFNQIVVTNTIYSIRDLLFFGETMHFIKLFENFFDDILNTYYGKPTRYININYTNFINTKMPIYKWRWFTYPQFIFSENFNTLKDNIIANMDKLNDINTDNNTCKFVSFMPHEIIKPLKFSSERIFPLHCINYGFIEGINLKINLYKGRKEFNYVG